MSRLQISKPLTFSVAITMIVVSALVIVAQSGRRAQKSQTTAPVPTPEASPEPTPLAKPTPAFTFIVGMDRYGDFSTVSLNASSGVLRSCVNRLDDSSSARADTTSKDISRGEAIRQAKAEKEAYVVWLKIRSDSFSGAPSNDPSKMYIEYAVFAPVTAKLETSGNAYPDARNARARVPTSTNQGDYYLNQAARGAAERILNHFHLRSGSALPNRLRSE